MADIGKKTVASVLADGTGRTLKTLIENRFDLDWMTDRWDYSRSAVFVDETAQEAYLFILRYWAKHRRIPGRTLFQKNFPPESLKLPLADDSAEDLLEMLGSLRRKSQIKAAGEELSELYQEGRLDDAEQLFIDTARKLRQQAVGGGFNQLSLGEGFDLDGVIDRRPLQGIPFGNPKIDEHPEFPGFQPGWLVAYLGRPKANKTTWLIRSAIAAARVGKCVLFFSVEISSEGIAARAVAAEARVRPVRVYGGNQYSDTQREKLAAANKTLKNLHVLQPRGRFTVDNLADALDKYQPDAVYIDGFYFMTDSATKETAANHEGQDNLARDLKQLAENRRITIVLSHQAREKQIKGNRGAGFDPNTAMGGTALSMYTDMFFTLDKDEQGLNHVRSFLSREVPPLPTLSGTWDWKFSEFSAIGIEDPDDAEDTEDIDY